MSKKSVGYSQVTGKKSYSPFLGNSFWKRRRCIPRVFFLAILYMPRKWLTRYQGRSVLNHSGVRPPLSNQLMSHGASSHLPLSGNPRMISKLLAADGASTCVVEPPASSSMAVVVVGAGGGSLLLPVITEASPGRSVSQPKSSCATFLKMSYQHSNKLIISGHLPLRLTIMFDGLLFVLETPTFIAHEKVKRSGGTTEVVYWGL